METAASCLGLHVGDYNDGEAEKVSVHQTTTKNGTRGSSLSYPDKFRKHLFFMSPKGPDVAQQMPIFGHT